MKRGLALLVAGALAAACGDSRAAPPAGTDAAPDVVRSYEARGIVKDVDAKELQVLIDHEDIPGLMPAMEMSFDVASSDVIAPLAPGQRVGFTLEMRAGHLRIVAAKVLEARAAPGRAGALAGVTGAAELAPDFALTDQNGAQVTLASLRGKTLLIDFIYTHCPGPCPILTGRAAEVQRALDPALRDHVHFVSITVDPERDTPEVLARYGQARGADLSRWSFLTGDPPRVRDVLKRYGIFAEPTQSEGEIAHIVVTLIVDAQGRVAKRIFGTEDGVAAVKDALEEVARR